MCDTQFVSFTPSTMPLSSDQQNEWLYFQCIAMVMNDVVNHHIAGVTDHVINQGFFSGLKQHVKALKKANPHIGD